MAADPGVGDEQRLATYAARLADAIEAASARWVRRSVVRRCTEAGRDIDPPLDAAVERAGVRCAVQVGPAVRALLLLDLDEQRSTPLALFRALAVEHPTEVLRDAGVAPVERDEFDRRAFPDDHYDLVPATFADLGDAVGEAALMWGAAKAHVHLARRRAEGMR